MRKVLFVTPICYVWRMSVPVHMNKTTGFVNMHRHGHSLCYMTKRIVPESSM